MFTWRKAGEGGSAHNFFVNIYLNFQRVLSVPIAPYASLLPWGQEYTWGPGKPPVPTTPLQKGQYRPVTSYSRATGPFSCCCHPKHFHSFLSRSCLLLCQREEPASCLFPKSLAKWPPEPSLSSSGCYLSSFCPSFSALCTRWPSHQHPCHCTLLWASLPLAFYSLSKHSHKGFVLLSIMSSRWRVLLALPGDIAVIQQ